MRIKMGNKDKRNKNNKVKKIKLEKETAEEKREKKDYFNNYVNFLARHSKIINILILLSSFLFIGFLYLKITISCFPSLFNWNP